MDDVKIVSEDAVRLVREGGVVNRGPRFDAQATPFSAEVCVQGPSPDPILLSYGTVVVVDVHHADECADCFAECDCKGPLIARHDAYHLDDCNAIVGCPDTWCHPDAEPGRWHWVVEPTGADDA